MDGIPRLFHLTATAWTTQRVLRSPPEQVERVMTVSSGVGVTPVSMTDRSSPYRMKSCFSSGPENSRW